MIKLTTKIYNDVIKTIDEDKKLNEEVKEYVKSLFVLQKKVNKITWKIAQDRMNEIKGREEHVIVKWNGANEEAVVLTACKHVIKFSKGSTTYSEYNGYGGWNGECYKCFKHGDFYEKTYKEEYEREIEKLRELLKTEIIDGKMYANDDYVRMDPKLEMFVKLMRLLEKHDNKKYLSE